MSDACRNLTDAGLDLLVAVLEDNVGILLADEVVVLQKLSRNAADTENLTASCHFDKMEAQVTRSKFGCNEAKV